MRQCHGSPWTQRKPRCLGSRAVWGQGLAIVSLWLPGPEAWLPRGNHLPWEFPEIFAACLWWYLHPVAAVVGVGPEDKDVNFDKREWLRPDRTSQHVYASWERNSPPAPPGAGDTEAGGRRGIWRNTAEAVPGKCRRWPCHKRTSVLPRSSTHSLAETRTVHCLAHGLPTP